MGGNAGDVCDIREFKWVYLMKTHSEPAATMKIVNAGPTDDQICKNKGLTPLQAEGLSERESLAYAGSEAINITPWSMTEIRGVIKRYNDEANWEVTVKRSVEAHSRSKTLFDGFRGNQVGSRSALWREYESEACFEE